MSQCSSGKRRGVIARLARAGGAYAGPEDARWPYFVPTRRHVSLASVSGPLACGTGSSTGAR